MTDLERAAAFEEQIRDRCAERMVETRFGPALFNDTHATVWNLNVLRVERPDDATAAEIAGEADRVQAGLGHRRVILPPCSAELEAGFRKLGWETDHFLFMVYRGSAEPVDAGRVEEVEPERLRRLREEIVLEWRSTMDKATVEEIMAADLLVWREANARTFAITKGGEVVSAAELYSDGRTAQVEDVATLPSHRGRGYAKATVTRAVEEALAGGHEFIFLVADGEGWPKDLYRKLGFEEVGSRFAFVRPSV
ncbi:MAG TPA: GNAT family N-acetyltransferase [Gaiellaceae bacterium]|jgi:ribosomal protein S18 acetylase RimI-like enzyme|nr:GNAT family N-acetyltransferase [Gaiellaceae bacterium]